MEEKMTNPVIPLNSTMIESMKRQISEMTRLEMGKMIRFSSSGTIIFQVQELYDHFMEQFNKLGGWTPQLSKLIGWKKV